MTLKNISIRKSDVSTATRNTQSTLAVMYLEEALNEGLCIEIPSLGIKLCREGTSNPEYEPQAENSLTKP